MGKIPNNPVIVLWVFPFIGNWNLFSHKRSRIWLLLVTCMAGPLQVLVVKILYVDADRCGQLQIFSSRYLPLLPSCLYLCNISISLHPEKHLSVHSREHWCRAQIPISAWLNSPKDLNLTHILICIWPILAFIHFVFEPCFFVFFWPIVAFAFFVFGPYLHLPFFVFGPYLYLYLFHTCVCICCI